MTYKLSNKSLERLENVHWFSKSSGESNKLSTCDFSVLEGKRSLEQQKTNVARGKPNINSKHLVQPDGYAHTQLI